jgi:hypothetical protein
MRQTADLHQHQDSVTAVARIGDLQRRRLTI